MEQITLTGEMTEVKMEALHCHEVLVQNIGQAAQSMVEVCRQLKEMRDRKLYAALGFSSLEDYTEKMFKIKKRQAYNYIAIYEGLEPQLLKENAGLGVTKLQLLTEVSAPDRREFVENNDLNGMTVAEVKALVEKTNGQCEQISMLEKSLADAQEEVEKNVDSYRIAQREKEELEESAAETAEEIEQLKRELAETKEKLEAAAAEPIEVKEIVAVDEKAVEEAKQEEKEKWKKKLEKEKEKLEQLEKKHEEELASVREAAAKEAEEKAKEDIAAIEKEKEKLENELAKAEKSASMDSNKELAIFSVHFSSLQKICYDCKEDLERIKDAGGEQWEKLKGALVQVLGKLSNEVEAME